MRAAKPGTVARWPETTWFVGCGNMGGAMLEGWIGAGMPPASVTAITRTKRALDCGVATVTEFPDGAPGGAPDMVVLAVKPHMLGDVADALNDRIGARTRVLSILAGTERAVLARSLPSAGHIVRVMPNMAVSIGKSPMILFAPDLDPAAREEVDVYCAALGPTFWLDEEDEMHLATALAGSGPAFVFRFIDALAKAAAALGMDGQQAARLALTMTEGAAQLAGSAAHDPAELARRVASPGGTTQAGLDVMDADDAANRLIERVLSAARARSAEMAAEARAG